MNRTLAISFLLLFSLSSCDMFQRSDDLPPPSPPNSSSTPWEMPANGLEYFIPRVDVTMTTGFGGYDNVSVLPGGLFIKRLRLDLPELSRQLPIEEYESLMSLFKGFLGFGDEYGGGCADGRQYNVKLSNVYYEKTIYVGCGIDHPGLGPIAAQLNLLVQEIRRLSQETYDLTAPWIGLTNSVSLNQQSYELSDTLRIEYQVVNPTDSVRTLYFQYEEPLDLRIDGPGPAYHSPDPVVACPDVEGLPCLPIQKWINPGEWILFSTAVPVSAFVTGFSGSTDNYRVDVRLLAVYIPFEDEEFVIQVAH